MFTMFTPSDLCKPRCTSASNGDSCCTLFLCSIRDLWKCMFKLTTFLCKCWSLSIVRYILISIFETAMSKMENKINIYFAFFAPMNIVCSHRTINYFCTIFILISFSYRNEIFSWWINKVRLGKRSKKSLVMQVGNLGKVDIYGVGYKRRQF